MAARRIFSIFSGSTGRGWYFLTLILWKIAFMVFLLFGGSELFCGHFSTDFLPLPVFRSILRQTLLRRSLDMAIESESKSPNHPAGIDQRDFSFSEKPHLSVK
jgi:hypothetical protein